MPRTEATRTIAVPAEDAFALSMSQLDVRYAWDPFVKEQRLLHGATRPDRGVQSLTKSKHGLTMITEYTSFKPPTQVGMKLVSGPPFFGNFAGGWSFKPVAETTTEATWRYTFSIKPTLLAPIGDRIGARLLGSDIETRLEHFARGCLDPDLVARAHAQLRGEG